MGTRSISGLALATLLGAAAFYLGRIAIADFAYDDGTTGCERAIKIDQSQADYHGCLGEALGDHVRHANVMKLAVTAGRLPHDLERAVALGGHSADGIEGLFDYYHDAPRILGGSHDRAIAEGETRLKPDFADAGQALTRLSSK